jgi:hypothetical protein
MRRLKLFQKPFSYLLNAEYISPQQRVTLRQMAIDEGIIAPGTLWNHITTRGQDTVQRVCIHKLFGQLDSKET